MDQTKPKAEKDLLEKDVEDKDSSDETGEGRGATSAGAVPKKQKEFGGYEKRPEPTRYGDWEINGRCWDF